MVIGAFSANATRRGEMKNELSSVVDALPGLVWTALPDGQVEFMSGQWREYTGLSLQDSCGDGWQMAIHQEDLFQLLEGLRSSVSFEAEVRIRRFDGEFRWFAVRANPITGESGAAVRYCGLNWDIEDRRRREKKNVEDALRRSAAERRHSEEALDKARSELAHVTRVMSLGALTASIAHEVNQPLSGIITNASTCMRMLDADPPNVDGARETARRTIRDGHRAADVITRLRALFSKKDGTSELVDLNQATREVIALSRRELERNRVILRTQLADNLPRVTGDRVQLQQVILNLLRNSSDAMSAVNVRPRELAFKTELEDGDHVRLSVRDTGKGFDPQTMDRLFHAFYTTKDGGMGMGLSVSRSIIENHQGRLWATANDGPGVTFMFTIPRNVETHEVSPGGISVKDQKSIARNS
jgi:PAS domain S-box-containing protein